MKVPISMITHVANIAHANANAIGIKAPIIRKTRIVSAVYFITSHIPALYKKKESAWLTLSVLNLYIYILVSCCLREPPFPTT